jgi:hypothetical protein
MSSVATLSFARVLVASRVMPSLMLAMYSRPSEKRSGLSGAASQD